MNEEIERIINRTEEIMDMMSSRKATFNFTTWTNKELPQ